MKLQRFNIKVKDGEIFIWLILFGPKVFNGVVFAYTVQVIWSNCQGRIEFSRLFFFRSWSKHCIFVPFLNKITLLLLDCLTIKNFLKICTKILHKSAKTCWEQIFQFLFFWPLVRKVPNIRNIAILAGVCAINSAKMKN